MGQVIKQLLIKCAYKMTISNRLWYKGWCRLFKNGVDIRQLMLFSITFNDHYALVSYANEENIKKDWRWPFDPFTNETTFD